MSPAIEHFTNTRFVSYWPCAPVKLHVTLPTLLAVAVAFDWTLLGPAIAQPPTEDTLDVRQPIVMGATSHQTIYYCNVTVSASIANDGVIPLFTTSVAVRVMMK